MEARTGRVPELDGIRGIAILLVLVGHGANLMPMAVAGVTLFFILSGYLITGRLLSGQTLRRFYANRARRLLPAMLVMLAITGAYFLRIGTPPWQLLEATVYVRDLTAPMVAPGTPWPHMWSLAVEEQFYLLWPLAVGLAWRGRLLAGVGVVTFTAMVAAYVAGLTELAHYSPATQAWTLCLGCWLALRGWAPAWPSWLGTASLRWFGTRSYGMYLWHYPLLVAGMYLGFRPWVGVVLGVGAAAVSWRYVESPFLRRGSPVGPYRRRPAPVTVPR